MTGDLPLTLLHGVGLDRAMWGPFTDEFRRLDARPVLALDLPGHGAQPPLAAETSLAGLSEQVAPRLHGRSHLVGFSLGALVAQHIARYRPELVASLTCVSSVCLRTPEQAAAVAGRRDRAQADFAASVEASISRWFPAEAEADPQAVSATRATLLANDVTSYLHAYRVFATADAEIWPELGRIVAPALVVTGAEDPGSTPEMALRLAQAIPRARAAIVPGARHMVPLQKPAELARLIHDFTTEASGGMP